MSDCVTLPPDSGPAGFRVLVVDADPHVRAHLEQLGRERLLAVVAVATPAEALAAAARTRFDAAFVDAALGLLAHDLRATAGHERVPLAYLSAENGVDCRIAAAHAGASLFPPSP